MSEDNEKEADEQIENGAFLESIAMPCNCTGAGGMQLHLSKTATVFLISLLDQSNPMLFKDLDPDSKKMILKFGKMLCADMKMAAVTGHGVKRTERKNHEPQLALSLDELLQVANEILNKEPIDTRPNMN